MASERTPRPGISLPGMRNSALATAALTSVALLSQTASATPAAAEDGPSRDEVRQRIDNLYDRAESDTGTFNATRAGSSPRKRAGSLTESGGERAGSAADDGRGRTAAGTGAGTGNSPRRQADPALDGVARQWFDAARAKLGPTVPAALPADRRPAQPASSRPARPASAPGLREQATADRPALELTAGSATALPPAPGAPQEARQADTPGALPATAAEPRPSSLRTTKERVQRQLAAARDLLTTHTAQAAPPSTPLAAIESRPAVDTWAAPAPQTGLGTDPLWQQQQPAATTMSAPLTMETPLVTETPLAMEAPLAMNSSLSMDASLGTGTPLPMDTPFTMAAPLVTDVPLAMDASFAFATPVPTAPPVPTQPPFAAPPPYPTTAPLQAVDTPSTGFPLTAAAPAPAGITQAPEAPAYEAKATRALAFARAQIGKPCVWGAAGPGSYDNAGLTQAAWRAAGVELPRTTPGQAASGTVVPLAETRVGDLVFFYDDLSHVGLYIGNGTMIHAPGPGAYIREESVFYAGESAIRGAVRPA
ncbi:NlpC/P60 family protein [Streptomyces sp. NBC_01352]|uniref:C40 family peptidase n=1 Tax=unclassified Streptomyces TaxID=2593676 RepID=UPI002E343B00|nr:NlpC/P60 family protein [Streptomyces sp. NBC_01352]